jgi:hypothetical protein
MANGLELPALYTRSYFDQQILSLELGTMRCIVIR